MTNALTWCYLRKWYMETEDTYLRNVLLPGFNSLVHDMPDHKIGDCGYVYFCDGSEIKWDWDNGDFECEGIAFAYPYDWDDPFVMGL